MSFFSKIKEHNAQLLVSQINNNGGNAQASVDSILDNLKFLTEDGESYGEIKKFIRLDVRRAIASLCDEGNIVFKIDPSTIKWAADDSSVSLGGYLHLIDKAGNDRIISSFACGGCARRDVFPLDSLEDSQRQAKMLSCASAKAESNAYYNMGLGIEYKGGDVFDLEAMEKAIPAPEPVAPEPKTTEERKAKKRTKAVVTAAPAVENTVQDSTADSVPAPAAETKPVAEVKEEPSVAIAEPSNEATEVPFEAETPETSSSDTLSYEDALNEILDVGNYKGQTIGTVLAKPQTARNIVWCIKNAPEGRTQRLTAALEAAVNGYGDGILKNYLNR